jgi:hypothetical protein
VKSEELFREIEEDLRRDRMNRLWQRYGGLVLGAALLIVVGTAGKVFWDHRQAQMRAEEAQRFSAAQQILTAGKQAEAADAFAAIAADGNTGFAELARLKVAEARAASGDQAGARTALSELQGQASDSILRDLATLTLVEGQVADGDPAELKKSLEPLAAPEAPWRNQARELLALVAIRAGNLDEARTLLNGLSQEAGVIPSQQRRAAELLEAIGGAAPQVAS